MTVQELIEHLGIFDPRLSVVVEVENGQNANRLVSLQKSDVGFDHDRVIITPN